MGDSLLVDRLLDEFGEEEHDGHGCIRVFFSHVSVRKMKKALGQQPVGLLQRYFHAYKVVSNGTGTTVTRGWRTRRLWRA